MKTTSSLRKVFAGLLVPSVLLAGCSSTTTIQSVPSGARVYLDGEAVGTTPYTHRDTKISGSSTTVRIEKEGYEPLLTSFSRNEEVDAGAIVGGIFVTVPFLWVMKYKPFRTYELVPAGAAGARSQPNAVSNDKLDKLHRLKQLLDEKAITQEEYDREKKKILEESSK